MHTKGHGVGSYWEATEDWGREEHYGKKRVACVVRGSKGEDRESTSGFCETVVLSDPCIPTATYSNRCSTTLSNRNPLSPSAQKLF